MTKPTNLGDLQQLLALLKNPEIVKALNAVQSADVTKDAGVSAKAEDWRLRRIAAIARGFERRKIKVTFDQKSGRFDNVKPYKSWLAEGRQVRKGEKSVRGFFHVSQTDVVAQPTKAELSQMAKEAVQSASTVALSDADAAELARLIGEQATELAQ